MRVLVRLWRSSWVARLALHAMARRLLPVLDRVVARKGLGRRVYVLVIGLQAAPVLHQLVGTLAGQAVVVRRRSFGLAWPPVLDGTRGAGEVSIWTDELLVARATALSACLPI